MPWSGGTEFAKDMYVVRPGVRLMLPTCYLTKPPAHYRTAFACAEKPGQGAQPSRARNAERAPNWMRVWQGCLVCGASCRLQHTGNGGKRPHGLLIVLWGLIDTAALRIGPSTMLPRAHTSILALMSNCNSPV